MITTAEEFVRLRRSEDPELYRRAAHEAAPDEVWLAIVDQYPDMRVWVINNKTVPAAILRMLASDETAEVRAAVAMTRRTEPDVLEILASDPDFTVRQRVVYNAKAPVGALRKLAKDEQESIAAKARARLEA